MGTTTSPAGTTTKPTCGLHCMCLIGCDGNLAKCARLPGCDSSCNCPNYENNDYDRFNWRCIMRPDERRCSPETTPKVTTTKATTTTPGGVTYTPEETTTPRTTSPKIITTTTPEVTTPEATTTTPGGVTYTPEETPP